MMLKKTYLTAFFLLFFILFSGFIIPAYSQTAQPPNFNQSYKVNVGDSMTYEYTIAQSSLTEFLTGAVILSNYSIVSFNITKGLQFTVKVVNKYSKNNVTVEEIYNIPKKGILVSRATIPVFYLMNAFDNSSMINDYKNYLEGLLSNTTNNSTNEKVLLAVSGDTFIENLNLNTNITQNSINETLNFQWNWKTGWLDQYEIKIIYSNGSIATWEKVQKTNDISNGFSIPTIDSNLIVNIAGILAIPVIFGIGAFIGLKMKKKP